jgi:DNA-binding transcriptional LysR family regulator
MISLAALRVLSMVVEANGIRGAAQRLGRTASTISLTLKQLEADIGAPLFEGDRKSKLTPLGAVVNDQARALVDHYDRACVAIHSAAQQQIGRVDLVAVPSVAVAFIPEVIRRLDALPGRVAVHLRDMDSRSIVEAMRSAAADAGIASDPGPQSDLDFTALFCDPLDIVCAADDPLTKLERPITWADIRECPFLAHGSYGSISSSAFHAIAVGARAHVRNVASLLALVRSGTGITLLPRLCRRHGDAGIAFLPVADAQSRRTVGILTRRGHRLSPAAQRFIEVITSVVAEHNDVAPAAGQSRHT